MGGSKRSRDLNLEAQSVPRPQLGGPEASQGPQLGDPKRSKTPTWRSKASPRPHLADPKHSKDPSLEVQAYTQPLFFDIKCTFCPIGVCKTMSSTKAGFDTPTWSCKPLQDPDLETSKLPKDPKLEAQGAPRLQVGGPKPRQCSILKTQSLQSPQLEGQSAPTPVFGSPKHSKGGKKIFEELNHPTSFEEQGFEELCIGD